MNTNLNHIANFKTFSKTENLESIRSFVFENSTNFGFNDYKAEELVLAVDEACTNLIKHAYKYNPDDLIIIELKSNYNSFIVNIIDQSPSFDPRSIQDPNMIEYRDEYKKGGLGIFIMKSLVDSIDYQIINNGSIKNILTLTKQLS
ncbi:MAG: ATP-binding protein [Candidatus Kapaibacterium sp.]